MDLLDAPPIILPKGIVVNTTDVYAEVASFPVLPVEKIRRYWHVYTITNKKLKDPTACRLEHFWWHVWGSDRRDLSGKKLARLFEDISTGPTFVPLRSVANRWEGPDMPPVMPSVIRHANSADSRGAQNGELGSRNHRHEIMGETALRSLSSSASKPPPAHPILKKSRGPSTTTPRPTARFLSPHGSPDESPKDPEMPSSSSATTAVSAMKAAMTPSPAKKKGHHTKRFVASSANKRRPMLPPRRGSSQTSVTGTVESSSRETPSSVGSSQTPDSQRGISPIAEGATYGSSKGSAESPLQPTLSAKAAGKRPAAPRRLTSEKKSSHKAKGSASPLLRSAVLDQAAREPSLSQSQPLAELPAPAAEFKIPALPSRSATYSEATPAPTSMEERPAAAPPMGRSSSHNGYERFKSHNFASSYKPGLFTGATASTTNIAAQGTIIDQSGVGALPPVSPIYGGDDPHGTLTSRGSSASLYEHRFTPTQPSPLASMPLARTKSQLTLLLERQKERTGDKSWSKR
ncbi:hypothetical protein LIA77_08534 [Sarocladium implicatum]|nr:hypothetical protein LIA77_08534 [Sarocladium implicatum]